MVKKEVRNAISPSENDDNNNKTVVNCNQNEKSHKDEIDLIELFLAFWKERRYIAYSFGFFFIIGLIVAFTSKEEYTSQVRLIPEGRQQSMSISLAQQFGLASIPSTTADGISTRFYPDIANSLPFLIPIMNYEIFYSGINDSISLFLYFTEFQSDDNFLSRTVTIIRNYSIRLPFTIERWFRKIENKHEEQAIPVGTDMSERNQIDGFSNIISLSNQELLVINKLRKRIIVTGVDGTIVVSAKMPEAKMAAELVDYVTISLIIYVKNYRTEKARHDVEFIDERHEEARLRFEQAQERLAQFRDQNRGQLTQMARTLEQRLQSEYDLTFNVYNTLARRLEEAKLKLQEETPVVQVLEPAVIPITPSEPRKEYILSVYSLIGIIFGIGVIFIKLVRIRILDEVRNKNKD